MAGLILHTKAVACAGDLASHLNTKITNFLIAVLFHDAEIGPELSQEHFLWVKGNAKVSIGKIKQAYINQLNDDSVPAIALKLGPYLPPDTTKMADLDQFHDRCVVLKAILPEQVGLILSDSLKSEEPLRSHSLQTTHGTSTPSVKPDQTPPKPSVSHAPMSQPYEQPTSILLQQPNAKMSAERSSVDSSLSSVSNINGAANRASSYESVHIKPEQKYGPSYSNGVPRDDNKMSSPFASMPPASVMFKSDVHLAIPLSEQPYIKREMKVEDHAQDDDEQSYQGQYQDPNTMYLQDLAKETIPEKLERGVEKGVHLLDQLKEAFGPALNTQEGHDWLTQVEAVRKEAVRARTVVGVVGNTGAGKSALLNALLDEERLLPTNCMRACTAVVTEMSHNDSDDEASLYRAEIEFIKVEEWEKELKVLFDEIVDQSGNISREVYNNDSDTGIAYAKIRAIYFRHTKEDLAASSVEKLMREQYVRNVLGTTKHIAERDCNVFYKRLQHYVDSKEKNDSNKKQTVEEKKSRKREMEFWPLIKVVRIYAKADALSTGAVVVDLPGVHDSNAARAAVAEGYMKQCTGLWIVAPITRAVDDKAAKNLLGDMFRRQLKYDGTYSAVTFVCSKTDDISNTEATESLGLGDQMSVLDDKLSGIETKRRQLRKQVKDMKDQKTACTDTMDDVDEQLESWDQLQEDFESGKTVYAPVPKSKKRKRSVSSDGESDTDYEEVRPPATSGTPLTESDIENTISGLKATKKTARRQRSEIDAQMKDVNASIADLTTRAEDIEAKRSAICIAGRNKYSKSAIQVDFAAGIKELDQENQAEEDPDTFDPEEDIRDYEEVARSLPVFCVSSRAYQKLSGRLKKDNAVKGFTDLEQTGIPALRAHCKRITEGTRASGCRRFLNSLSQLRTSLRLWATNNGTGSNLTDAERDNEAKYLHRKLRELEEALEKCIKDTLTDIKETLSDNIFENFDTAVKLASDAAVPTSSGWGAHRSEGGLAWATYKATVRRNGIYTGASGARDFNAELSEPLYKHLATGWEKAFQRRLPHVLRTCAKSFSTALRNFHKQLEQRAYTCGTANPRLGMLTRQLNTYELVFTDLANEMVVAINEQQRETNRAFTPTIEQAMERAYFLTTEERGTGSYARMKGHMFSEITANKDVMFRTATQIVQEKLSKMCKVVEEQMTDKTDAVFVSMQRDYIQVLGNNPNGAGQLLPKWERSMRRNIEEVIVKSEQAFKEVIDEGVGHQADAIATPGNAIDASHVEDEQVQGAEDEDHEG